MIMCFDEEIFGRVWRFCCGVLKAGFGFEVGFEERDARRLVRPTSQKRDVGHTLLSLNIEARAAET
jgi:hypothetical protein